MATIPNYPSNNQNVVKANSDSQQPVQREKVKPVIQGRAYKKHRTTKSILQAIFIPKDVESVRDYVIFDVIIPRGKDFVVNLGKSMLDAIFYGDSQPGRPNGYGPASNVQRISYSSISSQPQRVANPNGMRRPNDRSHAIFEDVVFDTRSDAEAVLNLLIDQISTYGVASVNDAYDACGLAAPYTGNNYGWTSLSTAEISRTFNGQWIIKFPKALPIE